MSRFLSPVRSVLAMVVALLLGACAGTTGPFGDSPGSGPAIEAPTYRVGDRLVYHVRDGFRDPIVYDETHVVTAVGADGITVRITMKGARVDGERIEKWAAPGRVLQGSLFDIETRRFAAPLDRYRFPLRTGQRWSQFVDNFNEFTGKEGQINRYVRVGAVEKVTTPAGTFDAIRLNVIMRLDDEEFWHWPTDCNYTIWYAPAVKASVRELKRADYLEKGGRDSIGRLPAQNATLELVSFTPGT